MREPGCPSSVLGDHLPANAGLWSGSCVVRSSRSSPVSAGLLADTETYFTALGDYRDGNPVPIVESVAEASFMAVENGRRLLGDLRTIRTSWDDLITSRRGSAPWRVADLLLQQPVIDMPYVRDQLGITSANAQIGIDRLVTDRIVTPIGSGRRDRLWQSPEVLEALESFASRARRGRR